MSMPSHILDPTAILAHYFEESGAATVNTVLTDERCTVAIPAHSLLELKATLLQTAAVGDVEAESEAHRAYSLYSEQLLLTLPITRQIAQEAAQLLSSCHRHLSPADALVAATARLESATLVHRKSSFDALPTDYVHQLKLENQA